MERDALDAVVVGGGVAGLQAALTLGRACRRVVVLDAGAPRNRFAAHSHNLLTHDGRPPGELLALGRADLAPYDVRIVEDRAVGARIDGGGFLVEREGGSPLWTRGLVVATGQRDRLPDVPGLARAWGESAFACPYCHAWEYRGRRFAVWGHGPYAAHMVRLVRAWTDRIHLLTDGPSTWDRAEVDALRAAGVRVHESRLVALEVDGRRLRAVRLEGSARIEVDVLLTRPVPEPASEIPRALGAELDADGLPVLGRHQDTTVPGLFVAGDLGTHHTSLPNALATGALAGAALNAYLVERAVAPEPRARSGRRR